jgi:hypothetical protein
MLKQKTMKTTMLLLLLSMAGFCFAQAPTLFEVTTVKPLALKYNEFEKGLKTHVAKYHTPKNRMSVFEVLTGPRTGDFYYVQPHSSWKELDVPRTDLVQHDMDYDGNVQPDMESNSTVEYVRYVDSLSHRIDGNFTSFTFTYYYVKPGKENLDFLLAEIRRGVLVNTKNNAPSNYQTYIKQLSGINPVIVIVAALKDGFAQLEPDYMAANSKKFKDTYLEMNGQDGWDKRTAFLPNGTDKVEIELVKFRDGLSTKQ